MDEHSKILTAQVNDIQKLLRLSSEVTEEDFKILPSSKLFSKCIAFKESMQKREITELFVNVFPHVSVLAYMTQRLVFFEYKRLDFDNFPSIDKLESFITPICTSKMLEKKPEVVIRKAVNGIGKVLDTIDKRYIDFREGLPYLYLRLFVLLLIFGMYVESVIVGNLILSQINIGVG